MCGAKRLAAGRALRRSHSRTTPSLAPVPIRSEEAPSHAAQCTCTSHQACTGRWSREVVALPATLAAQTLAVPSRLVVTSRVGADGHATTAVMGCECSPKLAIGDKSRFPPSAGAPSCQSERSPASSPVASVSSDTHATPAMPDAEYASATTAAPVPSSLVPFKSSTCSRPSHVSPVSALAAQATRPILPGTMASMCFVSLCTVR